MSGCTAQDQVLALLSELERRTTQEPDLVREWQEALRHFGSAGAGAGMLQRFRTWFFLERVSDKLGVPPAVAWAPDSIEDGDPWRSLLDSFFGIFRVLQRSAGQGCWLEDLWSRRAIWSTDAEIEAVEATDDVLWIGRFVGDGEHDFEALPGLLAVRAPGLLEAVTRDLETLRAQRPASRLSQIECERLLHPFLPVAQQNASAWSLGEMERHIKDALAGEPAWSLERVRERLAAGAAGELLDELAFDTTADLEVLRRWLPEYQQRLAVGAGRSAAPARRAAAVDVEAALARFDRGRSQGKSLEERFRSLESDLGLEVGVSREVMPVEEESAVERVGPPERTRCRIWIDTYDWERRAGAEPLASEERGELERLGAFLDAETPPDFEIEQLSPGLVLRYLLRHGRPAEQLQPAITALLPFLRWAAREQQAPLGEFCQEIAGELGARLGRIAALNQLLAASGPGQQRAVVVQAQPLGVAAEGNEVAAVDGLPAAYDALPEVGDTLLGTWHRGRFRAACLVPARALNP